MILKKGKKKLFNQRTALYVIVQSVPVSIEVFVPFSSFAGNLRLFKKVHLKAAKHIKVCRLPLVFVKILFLKKERKKKRKRKKTAQPPAHFTPRELRRSKAECENEPSGSAEDLVPLIPAQTGPSTSHADLITPQKRER